MSHKEQLAAFWKDAGEGCGCFYELAAQKFTDSVNEYLAGIADEAERALVLAMARDFDYIDEGRWVYDAEENDVYFRAA